MFCLGSVSIVLFIHIMTRADTASTRLLIATNGLCSLYFTFNMILWFCFTNHRHYFNKWPVSWWSYWLIQSLAQYSQSLVYWLGHELVIFHFQQYHSYMTLSVTLVITLNRRWCYNKLKAILFSNICFVQVVFLYLLYLKEVLYYCK